MAMRRGGALIRPLIPISIFKPPLSSYYSSSKFQTAKSSSPFESNLLRIISNEIQYHFDYAPPHQPVSEFDRFMVEDRPGERWITLRTKSESGENIKIEATMFDGHAVTQQDENVRRLHISMLVDIWKGDEGTRMMEFVCSAWPDSLEIQKVYIFTPDANGSQPYMGPDIKNLNAELRTRFYDFLKTRGVNDDLSKFLHEYMMNKDRIELVNCFSKLQSFFQP